MPHLRTRAAQQEKEWALDRRQTFTTLAWRCQPLLLLAAVALLLPSRAQATILSSSAASEPSGLIVSFSYTTLVPGQPVLVNVTIHSSHARGRDLKWADLAVDAARRLHIMLASCTSFQHVHVEDFAQLPRSSPMHQDGPRDNDTTFLVWFTLPSAGRYVAGVEFAPTVGEAQGVEQVAFVPLVIPSQPGADAPLDTSCHVHDSTHKHGTSPAVPMDTASARFFSASPMTGGVYVGVVSMDNSTLPVPAAGQAPLDPDKVVAHLAVCTATQALSVETLPVPPLQQLASALPVLSTGVCYRFELTFWDYGGPQRPVDNLVPWLTHTMHLALLPLSSLWNLHHFHALAVGMKGMGTPADPCDMGDGDMPSAPARFGPKLVAWWRFSRPGAFRLLAQTVRAGDRMLLPFWTVHVE